MSSVAARLSVEEYLNTTYKPACDYVDGVLYQKSLPTKFHSIVQFLLILALRKQGFEALHEITLRMSPSKYLVPDVIADRHIEAPYPTKPVTLCVEVLSPEDRLGATLSKCEEYHAWGVPYCWVIDPVKETAWEYHAGGEPVKRDHGANLTAGSIVVALDDLVPAGGVEPPTYGL